MAHTSNVVAFPARAASESAAPVDEAAVSSSADDEPVAREAATLILSLARVDNNAGEYRIVGVNDALPLGELIGLVSTCFGDPVGDVPGVGAQVQPLDLGEDVDLEPLHTQQDPWWGEPEQDTGSNSEPLIGDVLRTVDDTVVIRATVPEGPEFMVSVLEAYLRDAGTPDALCIGGDGATEPDVGAINATLTGTETMQAVLATARPELRELISRSGMFDFVPLLQALDLGHEVSLPADVLAHCRRMPRESTALGRDAALVQLMCQASPIDEALRADICVTTMAALGWRAPDGGELSVELIDAASAATLTDLYHLGLVSARPVFDAAGDVSEVLDAGDPADEPPTQLRGASAVDRLEVCRAILADPALRES